MYWYKTYRMPKQQSTTQIANLSLINNHIVGSKIGELELNEITTRDVQEFLTTELMYGKKTCLKHLDLRGTSLSPHTVIKLRQILIAMFRQAMKEK